MQRAEMEELRQREANLTALQAIGPRKKPRLDNETTTGSTQVSAILIIKRLVNLNSVIVVDFTGPNSKPFRNLS